MCCILAELWNLLVCAVGQCKGVFCQCCWLVYSIKVLVIACDEVIALNLCQGRHYHHSQHTNQRVSIHRNLKSLLLVEEVLFILCFDNNDTKICNSRTTVLLVMELALLLVMVAVELMFFSLDLPSKLVVLDTLTDTKLCQNEKGKYSLKENILE